MRGNSLMGGKDQVVLLVIILGLFGVYTLVHLSLQCSQSALLHSPRTTKQRWPSLVVSELPGYTGWARPATTLASHFRIKRQDEEAWVQHNWTVTVTCDGCSNGEAVWFYGRAYGPGILNGVIERQATTDDYKVTFHPVLEGPYMVEVVVTFSYPIDPDNFPLTKEQRPPFYEGYLLPSFPLQLIVATKDSSKAVSANDDSPYCSINELTLTEQSRKDDHMWNRASWSIVSNNRQYSANSSALSSRNNSTSLISRHGYIHGLNSVGFTASYEFSGCRLVKDYVPSSVATVLPSICPNPWRPKIHLVMIGDSVMLLQKNWIEEQLAVSSVDKVNISMLELWGGVLRCARLTGPNLTTFIHDNTDNTRPRVVVFNTGLHEIYRLCSDEEREERLLYLTKAELRMTCTTLYRSVIRDLVSTILLIPAEVYIFQTTTAAWLRYGNFGVAWDPEIPQGLPLDAAFVERFNDIAIAEIQSLTGGSNLPRIHIVDAYWISIARPDNREIGGTGRKLVHPGLEVASHMVRMWWQVALQQLCNIQK